MSGKITYNSYQKDTVYSKYGGRCGICGKPVSRYNMTISHKLPLSCGGTNGMENLILSCRSCSRIKQDLTMEEFLMKIQGILEHRLEIEKATKSFLNQEERDF